MRRVVAQDLDTLGHVAGDDRHRGVMVDQRGEVARSAVDLDRDRRFGEAGPDRRRQFGTGQRRRKLAAAAVRQGHRDRLPWARRRCHYPVGILAHRALCSVEKRRSDGAKRSRKNPVRRPAGFLWFKLCCWISAQDLRIPRHTGW